MASRSFALSCGEPLQDTAPEFLQFAEAREVILKIVVQELRLSGVELCSQNHVAQLHGVRKQCVFLKLFQGQARIVVVHGFPLRGTKTETPNPLYSRANTGENEREHRGELRCEFRLRSPRRV